MIAWFIFTTIAMLVGLALLLGSIEAQEQKARVRAEGLRRAQWEAWRQGRDNAERPMPPNPPGQEHRTIEPAGLSVEEAAILGGGHVRLVETIITEMFRAGQLKLVSLRLFPGDQASTPSNAVHCEVHRIAIERGSVMKASAAIKPLSRRIKAGLVERGFKFSLAAMLRRSRQCRILLTLSVIAMCSAVAFSGIDWFTAGFLVVWSWLFFWKPDAWSLTPAGKLALEQAERSLREDTASMVDVDSPLGWAWTCALFGREGLSNDEHKKLKAQLKEYEKYRNSP